MLTKSDFCLCLLIFSFHAGCWHLTSNTLAYRVSVALLKYNLDMSRSTPPKTHTYCFTCKGEIWGYFYFNFVLHERHVSNHGQHDCLFTSFLRVTPRETSKLYVIGPFVNCLFRDGWKKTSNLRVTGLYTRNSPVAGDFLAQRACNAENISIWWRYHAPTRAAFTHSNTAKISMIPDKFQSSLVKLMVLCFSYEWLLTGTYTMDDINKFTPEDHALGVVISYTKSEKKITSIHRSKFPSYSIIVFLNKT